MLEVNTSNYIDYKVYSVTPIKKKYGYRVNLIYPNGVSKTIQKSGYRTKKEANEHRNLTITELHNGTFIISESMSVEELFTHWLEDVMKPKITACSYDAYKNIVYNYVIPFMGKRKVNSLNRGDIQKFYNEKAQYSHSAVRLCKTIMNIGLDYAVKNKIIKTNIAREVNLPKCIKSKKYRTITINTKKTFTEEQVKLLLEKSKATPIYMQVLFAVLMGLRKGEINGIKYSDIDYVHRKLNIQRQLGKKANTNEDELTKGEYTKQEIKVKTYSSNRQLDIPDVVFEAILEERKKYERNRNRRINDKTNPFKDYEFICCSTYGNPRSKSFHFKYWKQLLKENNLPDIRFHDLRATYCTLLVKNNFNLKAISNMMGHSTEIISVDVYTNNEEIITDCLKELEPFINDVIPEEVMIEISNFDDDEDLKNTEKYFEQILSV